jgi:hypothetical protein
MSERPSNSETESAPEKQLVRATSIIRELMMTIGDPEYDASDAIDDGYQFLVDRGEIQS